MADTEFPVTRARHDLASLVAEVDEVRSRVDRRAATTRMRASAAPPPLADDARLAPTVRAIPCARPASVPPPASSRPLPEPSAARYSFVPSRRGA